MKVSVVVPVFNEEKYIASCLEHIFDQKEKPYEVIIVDNNSTDNTIEIAKTYPVKIIRQKIQGTTPARNKGFDKAMGDVIARTDADTLVPKDWIKTIKKRFADKDIVAFSGPARFNDLSEPRELSKIPMYAYFITFKRMFHHDSLFGPNMAIRRSAWRKIRNKVCLDDRIVHEDIDLSLHISQYGKIAFDFSHVVTSSARRWKKIRPYYEYPLRYLKTIKQHHESLVAYKKSTMIAKTIILRTKKLVGTITDMHKTNSF